MFLIFSFIIINSDSGFIARHSIFSVEKMYYLVIVVLL
jgi:hypothetical protein